MPDDAFINMAGALGKAVLPNKKIDEMEQFIASCEYELNPQDSLMCP